MSLDDLVTLPFCELTEVFNCALLTGCCEDIVGLVECCVLVLLVDCNRRVAAKCFCSSNAARLRRRAPVGVWRRALFRRAYNSCPLSRTLVRMTFDIRTMYYSSYSFKCHVNVFTLITCTKCALICRERKHCRMCLLQCLDLNRSPFLKATHYKRVVSIFSTVAMRSDRDCRRSVRQRLYSALTQRMSVVSSADQHPLRNDESRQRCRLPNNSFMCVSRDGVRAYTERESNARVRPLKRGALYSVQRRRASLAQTRARPAVLRPYTHPLRMVCPSTQHSHTYTNHST